MESWNVIYEVLLYYMSSLPHLTPESMVPEPIRMEDIEHIFADLDLKLRHKLVLLNYANTRNWSTAYKLAGYKGKYAGQLVWLMKRRWPDMERAIKRLDKFYIISTFIKKEHVLAELAKIAFADIADYIVWTEDTVELKPSEVLLKNGVDTSIIQEISVSHTKMGKNVKLKLYDKMAALGKIGQFLHMFDDRLEITGLGGGPIQIDHRVKQALEDAYGKQEDTQEAEYTELEIVGNNIDVSQFFAEWEDEEKEVANLIVEEMAEKKALQMLEDIQNGESVD